MLLHVTLTCCCIRCYHTVTTLPCTLSYQFTFAFRSRNHHTETNIHHTFTTFFFKHHLIHHSHSDSPPLPPTRVSVHHPSSLHCHRQKSSVSTSIPNFFNPFLHFPRAHYTTTLTHNYTGADNPPKTYSLVNLVTTHGQRKSYK